MRVDRRGLPIRLSVSFTRSPIETVPGLASLILSTCGLVVSTTTLLSLLPLPLPLPSFRARVGASLSSLLLAGGAGAYALARMGVRDVVWTFDKGRDQVVGEERLALSDVEAVWAEPVPLPIGGGLWGAQGRALLLRTTRGDSIVLGIEVGGWWGAQDALVANADDGSDAVSVMVFPILPVTAASLAPSPALLALYAFFDRQPSSSPQQPDTDISQPDTDISQPTNDDIPQPTNDIPQPNR